jgi:hypothetical protein
LVRLWCHIVLTSGLAAGCNRTQSHACSKTHASFFRHQWTCYTIRKVMAGACDMDNEALQDAAGTASVQRNGATAASGFCELTPNLVTGAVSKECMNRYFAAACGASCSRWGNANAVTVPEDGGAVVPNVPFPYAGSSGTVGTVEGWDAAAPWVFASEGVDLKSAAVRQALDLR